MFFGNHKWGGIRKAETEVVRIKRRRRDKGGGRVGEANQQGGRIMPLSFCQECMEFQLTSTKHKKLEMEIYHTYTMEISM